jgi:hypothetical protein
LEDLQMKLVLAASCPLRPPRKQSLAREANFTGSREGRRAGRPRSDENTSKLHEKLFVALEDK